MTASYRDVNLSGHTLPGSSSSSMRCRPLEGMAEPRDGAADAGTGYVEAGLDSCETGQSLGEKVAFLPRGDPPVITRGGSRLAPPWNELAFGSLCGQTDGVRPQAP